MFAPNPLVKLRSFATAGLVFLSLLVSMRAAAPVAKDADKILDAQQPGVAFSGTPSVEDLDTSTFAEWADGKETAIDGSNRERNMPWLVWTKTGNIGHSGISFGLSANPGVRHLRVGFKASMAVGTVMVNGGGVLSVLKPGATYPGDLNNDSQWQPAQRFLADGQLTSAPVARGEYALWLLPPSTKTRALRFSHTTSATDTVYQGWIGGVVISDERFVNQAPYATASARSSNQNANRLNNNVHEVWNAWENRPKNAGATDAEPVISADNAEWVLLTWPAPVKLEGLAINWPGFVAADVQTYAGPSDRHPRDGLERDWQPVASYGKLINGYPRQLSPNWLDFKREVTTRALRIRITDAGPDATDGHLKGNKLAGRRVWLGEIFALQSIGTASLPGIKPPVAVQVSLQPPIPVKFTLKEAGYVTLVIERASDGVRVRNLISETPFPAGENTVWWDATDDLGRDVDAAKHGIYRIPARFVEPGEYRVRGLVRGEIDPRYEFSVYTTGNPPWGTADHTGAWLANHAAPQAAAFVPGSRSPTGQPAVYLGCYVTEGPDGLAWVDLDGRKRGGKKWIGGAWTAAPYLAADTGNNAAAGVYVYVGSVWEMEKKSKRFELRITALTPKEDKAVLVKPLDELVPDAPAEALNTPDSGSQIGGLAVRDGVIAVSLTALNQVVFIKAADGSVLGRAPLPAPRGLAFDKQGRLLALSGAQLVRFDALTVPEKPGAAQKLIESGLEQPIAVTTGEDGAIYVSDRGASHQVKIFTAAGRAVGVIGKPGKPKAGPYDPLKMQNPAGIAIDSKQQLWVTEDDFLPKRVSVWTLDGKLVNAFYGPAKYGGGGTLDSTDKTKFYYADEGHGAMEFKLDWAKGAYELKAVFYRPGPDDLKLAFRAAAPESAIYFKGQRYFTNVYNSSPVSGHSTAFLFVERDGVARPVAAMGRGNDWPVLKGDAFRRLWPEGVDLAAEKPTKVQLFFIWNDLNGDAQAQPDEVTLTTADASGVTVMDDLSFCIARVDGKTMRYAPTSVDANGVPHYDATKDVVLASGVAGPASSGGNQVLVSPGGWTALTLGMSPFSNYSVSGAKDGVAKWSYPNLWPGLHASHESPPSDHPGELIGTTRLLGGLMNSKIGPLWAVNSNQGCIYVFTDDGLFVATIFHDTREGIRWQMPVVERGMSLKELTLSDENFWPTISQLPDGTVYLVDGGRSSLVRLDGLNNLTRLPDTRLTLTKEDLDKSRSYLIQVEAARQQAQGRGVLGVIGRRTAPVVDGKLDDWPTTNWVDIDKRGVHAYFNSTTEPYNVTGSVAVSGGRLYAAWRAADAKLIDNSGEMPIALFKTGGALDLMIGANPKADPSRAAAVAGDVRLLVTLVKGKPRALLYRAVVPGTLESARVPFSSPWRTMYFDRVDDVTDQIEFATADGNYEISIALDRLLLKPATGLLIKGDIGILRGQDGQTTARIYWSNKATGITADVPSEAVLTPGLWGDWEFRAE